MGVINCSSKKDFIKEIVELLEKPHKATKIGFSGQNYVRDNYDWNAINRRLEERLLNICHQN